VIARALLACGVALCAIGASAAWAGPPVAQTLPVSAENTCFATFNGVVTSDLSANWYVEWGMQPAGQPTAPYSRQTSPQPVPAGTKDLAVSMVVGKTPTDLAAPAIGPFGDVTDCSLQYHYRLVVVNADAPTTGQDVPFSLPLPPKGGAQSSHPCVVPRLRGLTLAAATARVKTHGCHGIRVRIRHARRRAAPRHVVAQDPSPGTLTQGTITLTLM
jgi:hypothetical protein